MNRLRWFNGWLAALGLLALHWVMAVTATRQQSTTFDEIAHLTAGYSYGQYQDYRLQPENGNLPQRWAALPLVFDKSITFPRQDQPMWRQSFVWGIGHQFFYQTGNDADSILWRGRVMIALFSVALGVLVYAWSRQLFGPLGGLISVLLFTFCPAMLAHGARATSDMAAALLFVAASWTWWRLLHRLTPSTILLSGVSFGLLCVAKMSAVVFPPVAVLLLGVRLLSSEPLAIGWWKTKPLTGRWRQLLLFSGAGVALTLVAVLVIWSFYSFRYSAFSPAKAANSSLAPVWETVLDKPNLWKTGMKFLREQRLLPEGFLYGYSYVYKFSQTRSAFLNGEYSQVGFKSFFPVCWLLKTPLAVFALLALAVIAALCFSRNRWRGLYITSPLWIFFSVYWIFALVSHLNLGHRHLLPIYPAMYIVAGAAALWFARPLMAGQLAVGLVSVLFIVESQWHRPHYLAFFNRLAGGPSQGYRHLVDSSLDWGQDLPLLKRWLDVHAAKAPAYLSYFGTGDPAYYKIKAHWLPGYPDLGVKLEPAPLTGGIYCISATMLQQVYSPFMGRWAAPYERTYQQVSANLTQLERTRDDPSLRQELLQQYGTDFWNQQVQAFQSLRFARLCAYLRQRAPDDMVGYSILIYRLSDREVQEAISGPPAELTPTIQIKGRPS